MGRRWGAIAVALAVSATGIIGITSTSGAGASGTLTVDQRANRLVLSWNLPASDSFKIDTGFPFWAPWTQDGRYPSSVLDSATVPRGTYTAMITGLKGGQVTGTATGQVTIGGDTPPTTVPGGAGKLAVTVSVNGSKVSLNWSHPSSGAPATYKIDTGFPWWGPWTQDGRWTGSTIDVSTVLTGTYEASVSALNSAGAVIATGSVAITVGRDTGTTVTPTTTTAPLTTTRPASSTTSPSTTTTGSSGSGNSESDATVVTDLPFFVSGKADGLGLGVECVDNAVYFIPGRAPQINAGYSFSRNWTFTAKQAGLIKADSTGSGVDTGIIVFEALSEGPETSYQPVFCANDGDSGSVEASVTFSAKVGSRYVVGVGPSVRGSGNYVQMYVSYR
jgi:hypothetical protein